MRFLYADETFYKHIWTWSEFLSLPSDYFDAVGKVYFEKINAIIMCYKSKEMILRKITGRGEIIKAEEEFDSKIQTLHSRRLPHNIQSSPVLSDWLDKHSSVVNVEGAFLHIFNAASARHWNTALRDASENTLIKVDSTNRNLQNVALGIGSRKPVCLSGPVGSGKTSLIEHLAARTGRLPPKIRVKQEPKEEEQKTVTRSSGKKRKNKAVQPEPVLDVESVSSSTSGFLRIQLGHETDSKMLLGQYCCTDIPGEFVWQPGVLTQAVVNGYWLLLEDLDCATQDVCTVLTNLLELGYLNVPGFKDSIRVEPGFQLFFTIR